MEWADLDIRWELVPTPPDRIRVHAVVSNRSGRALDLELPYCVVRIRLYREGRLAWDEGGEGDCDGIRRIRLAPGEASDFWSSATADEVLGPDLPPGDFLARIYLPGSRRPGPPRADLELTLGEITLTGD